jgi:hypothetical protein
MAKAFEVAGDGRVLWILEVAMGPTVGDMWAKIGTAWLWDSAGRGNEGGRCSNRRWSDSSGSGVDSRGCGCIGSMVSSTAGSCCESAVLVGGTEVDNEVGEGLGGFRLGTPIAAGNVKETGGMNEVVAKTNDRGFGGSIIAGSSEANTIIKLGEELVNGGRRMPWSGHAEGIGIQFDLCDGTPSCP